MISAAILYCISILYVCYYAQQTNWLSIISPIAIAGICFAYFYKRIKDEKQLKLILMLVLQQNSLSSLHFQICQMISIDLNGMDF